jgi:acyl CoA:acetate/3-ketoacid CoA transferase alpha subunit
MDKTCSLTDAVKSIPNGSHVALSGFAITRCNIAFAAEVIRQNIHDLTISQCVGAMDTDLLVGANVVKKVVYGGGSLDRFGRLSRVNQAIEEGTIAADEFSSLSITFRYLAGALGIPFIPIRSINGSDLWKKLLNEGSSDIANVTDPFTGDSWLALKPLAPDVSVVQVQVADSSGNAWIEGPHWDNAEQVRAAKRTIVITEKLITTEEIRQKPEKTVIPGLYVSHVVELPFSAHPTSVFGAYDYDADHIKLYAKAAKTGDGFKEYLDKFVFGAQSHEDYLSKVGGKSRLDQLVADEKLGY